MTHACELTAAECVSLLSTAHLGRLVYTENALPAIRPVRFRLDGDSVVIGTLPCRRVAGLPGAVVAFEADDIDLSTRTGWSVVVVGKAEAVTDIDEQAPEAPPAGGTAGGPLCSLRIRFGKVTGRRVVAAGDAA